MRIKDGKNSASKPQFIWPLLTAVSVGAQQAENLQLKQQNELLLQRLIQLEALVKALDEKR